MNRIRSALDWLGWERLSETRHHRQEVINNQKKIMATQQEITAQLNTLTAQLAAANAKIQDTNTKVIKIGQETDGLLQKIEDLEEAINNQSNASPELVAAFEAAKAQGEAVATSLETLSASAQAGDEKVPDATPPVEPAP